MFLRMSERADSAPSPRYRPTNRNLWTGCRAGFGSIENRSVPEIDLLPEKRSIAPNAFVMGSLRHRNDHHEDLCVHRVEVVKPQVSRRCTG